MRPGAHLLSQPLEQRFSPGASGLIPKQPLRVKLTASDLGALTPLFWEHVNPYGRFELDMDARLPID